MKNPRLHAKPPFRRRLYFYTFETRLCNFRQKVYWCTRVDLFCGIFFSFAVFHWNVKAAVESWKKVQFKRSNFPIKFEDVLKCLMGKISKHIFSAIDFVWGNFWSVSSSKFKFRFWCECLRVEGLWKKRLEICEKRKFDEFERSKNWQRRKFEFEFQKLVDKLSFFKKKFIYLVL